MLKSLIICFLAATLCLGSDPSAEALAREAKNAQNHGQVVRAYLLFAEAAARDPQNESYRFNRESLKPLANLLSKSKIEPEPSREDLLASVPLENGEPIEPLDAEQEKKNAELQAPPKLQFESGRHSFHIKSNERALIETVARAYRVDVVFDPEFQPSASAQIDLDSADFREALNAVTESTGTFLFPISPRAVFVARDNLQKRDEYEPEIVFTVPVSDVADQKEIVEIANAARQVFELKHIAFDTEKRAITVRDRISRARAAQVLIENMVHPRPQISIEVQILSLDEKSSLHYGLTIPSSIPIVNLGRFALKQSLLNLPQGFTNLLTFGGGQTLFGIGVIGAESFAMSSHSWTQSIFDTLTVVSSGQTADLHIGDKFPIAQALYTGVSQLPNAAYAPPPQIEQIELGIVLKMTPHLHGSGSITIDIEAAYKALGNQSFNTVPEILQRELKETVQLEQGQWAVLGGLETHSSSVNRGGLAALTDLPVASELLGDINKSRENAQTLVIIKPHVIRDAPAIEGGEYFVGGGTGTRVLL